MKVPNEKITDALIRVRS